MLALLFALACAPSAEDADPCSELQAELAACGFELDAYECEPGDGGDPVLLGCMAEEIAAEGCPPSGTANDYTALTGPAFEACSGAE